MRKQRMHARYEAEFLLYIMNKIQARGTAYDYQPKAIYQQYWYQIQKSDSFQIIPFIQNSNARQHMPTYPNMLSVDDTFSLTGLV